MSSLSYADKSYSDRYNINEFTSDSQTIGATHLAKITQDNHQNLIHHYQKLIESINQTLITNRTSFMQSPTKLADYVDAQLLSIWYSPHTLKRLFGTTSWKNFDQIQIKKLNQGFNNTLQRYVQEGFKLYDGQQIQFVSLQLNSKATLGLLTIEVIPNVLPRFKVSFKIFNNNNEWFLYDALFQGASYISLKKQHFRQLLDEKGIDGVITAINQKNQGYLPSKLVN
ncbi:MlaC/ttg2D family ABC transporter substrate-binding protein [Aliikangiella maris]|uniref:ABC transporter substrate-binding protein n=2 Tax=Aliikangiella maris TaxID=3162458 RepID=A0ABV2BNZ0_9GAMM